MAIRSMTPPAQTRTRTAKRRYTDKELQQAVKMLENGEQPGSGPYNEGDEDKSLRRARSEAQALVREIKRNVDGDADIGTRAWVEDDGAHFALRVK